MESVREARFIVYIDTNKRTIEDSFDNIQDLIDFVESLDDETFGWLKHSEQAE